VSTAAQGYGMTTNGVTTFINASNCLKHKLTNPPIIIDMPCPAAHGESPPLCAATTAES
jgi:hypothetical protein